MTVDIHDIENRLWDSADELRANSGLKESEYSIPTLGLMWTKSSLGSAVRPSCFVPWLNSYRLSTSPPDREWYRYLLYPQPTRTWLSRDVKGKQ